MININKIAIALIAASLTACAGAPVGYGGTYKVEYADPGKIIIQWDNLLSSETAVRKVATSHCAQFKRHPVVVGATSDPLTMGGIKTLDFNCVADAQ